MGATGPGLFGAAPPVSAALALLAERVATSVVAVRGSPWSAGSGVIWDRRGLVVTNHHVVPGDAAEVVLLDGARLPARATARSARLDLVALRVAGALPGGELPAAAIGDSTRLRVGELVVAVGNPLGERNAVTLGVVSGAAGSSPVLQVAIALRPGNSGGALADALGRVVGIPHMVTGTGLALAVPSRTVERFLAGAQAGEAAGGAELEWV